MNPRNTALLLCYKKNTVSENLNPEKISREENRNSDACVYHIAKHLWLVPYVQTH